VDVSLTVVTGLWGDSDAQVDGSSDDDSDSDFEWVEHRPPVTLKRSRAARPSRSVKHSKSRISRDSRSDAGNGDGVDAIADSSSSSKDTAVLKLDRQPQHAPGGESRSNTDLATFRAYIGVLEGELETSTAALEAKNREVAALTTRVAEQKQALQKKRAEFVELVKKQSEALEKARTDIGAWEAELEESDD
jgi:hypothetical protein